MQDIAGEKWTFATAIWSCSGMVSGDWCVCLAFGLTSRKLFSLSSLLLWHYLLGILHRKNGPCSESSAQYDGLRNCHWHWPSQLSSSSHSKVKCLSWRSGSNCRWQELQVEQNCIYITPRIFKGMKRLRREGRHSIWGRHPRPWILLQPNATLSVFPHCSSILCWQKNENVKGTTGGRKPITQAGGFWKVRWDRIEFSDKLLRLPPPARQVLIWVRIVAMKQKRDSENYSSRRWAGRFAFEDCRWPCVYQLQSGTCNWTSASSGPNLMNIQSKDTYGRRKSNRHLQLPDGYDLIATQTMSN